MTKFFLKTYGCQMNALDSEVIDGLLRERDFSPVSSMEEAEVIILNTCCVREKTEHKVYGKLGQIKSLKQHKPELVVALCGCMSQAYGAELLEKEYPLDLVMGTGAIDKLPDALLDCLAGKGGKVECSLNGHLPPYESAVRKGTVSAFVEIMRGCDNYCTYCVVPYVRGAERSRAVGELESEVRGLVERGYRQVILIGQNVNSYRDNGTDFPPLLRRLAGIPGLKRTRFTTSHPKDLSSALIKVMAEVPTVCEHLHLPLQAGSDSVLAKMGRGYTAADYLRLLEEVRQALPEISVSTDMMVGFPGETEEDFQATLDIVEQARFNCAFTFVYTDRPKAKSSGFSDKVPLPERRERLSRLNELQNSISDELTQRMVGKQMTVLVEEENRGGDRSLGVDPSAPQSWRGRSGTNYLVFFTGETKPGEEVAVKINSAKTWTLFGKMVS